MASLVALGALPVERLVAQGPGYRERWGYLHLEARRQQVWHELQGRPDADRRAVARLLAEPCEGVPFRPVARALAHLRGVPCDDRFLLRAMVGAFVLPEVVDPISTVPACRGANVSAFLPCSFELPGALSFDVVIRDATDAVVFEYRIERNTSHADLRLGQAEATWQPLEPEDGRYQVELRTLVDGEGPRPSDPVLRWTFHVLRGYQARAEAALSQARGLREQLDSVPRALLDGFALHVTRAYRGEAFAVASDAVLDLQRLERCLDNLQEQRPPLAGIDGAIPAAMPAGDIVQPCLLQPAAGTGDHALVVFATGAPAYGIDAVRPEQPQTRAAAWLAAELDGFGAEHGWHVAYLDSPGGGRPYAAALAATLAALPEVLPTGGRKPLLVCDREAAGVVGLHLGSLADAVAGVVLVGTAAVPTRVLDALDSVPVRLVELADYPASRTVPRLLQFLASRADGDAAQRPDIRLLHERQPAWPFGLAASRHELAAFARELFGRR